MGIQKPFVVRNGLEVANDGLVVNSTNLNVGIGTYSPQYDLDVSGDINYTGTLYNNGSVVQFGGGEGGGESYWVKTLAGINTVSNVGINTSTPTSKLHVVGNVLVSGTGIVTATRFIGDGSGLTNVPIGFVTYTSNSGIASYATISGIASYSTTSGIASYAITSGISTISQGLTGTPNLNVGIVTATRFIGDGSGLTNVPIGFVTYTSNSGIASYATISGIASYSTTSGIATYATTSGISSYSTNSDISSYSITSGISSYSINSGIATYATTSGISSYSTNSGIASYAIVSGISTVSQGLTGTPNLNVGIVTATRFIGDGSGLTGILSYWSQNVSGINTLSNVGIGTTNSTSKLTVSGNVMVSGSGIVTATKYYGDGSALTGISSSIVTILNIPVSPIGLTTGFSQNIGTAVYNNSSFTGGIGTIAYTINDIVYALKSTGILANYNSQTSYWTPPTPSYYFQQFRSTNYGNYTDTYTDLPPPPFIPDYILTIRGSSGCILLPNKKIFYAPQILKYQGNGNTGDYIGVIYDVVSSTYTYTSVFSAFNGLISASGGACLAMTLLPSGKVFCLGYNGFASGFAKIYDPDTDTYTLTSASFDRMSTDTDVIGCVTLQDGRVFIGPNVSISKAYIYDPITDTTIPLNITGSYWKCTLLYDGRVFIVPYNSTTALIFDPRTNSFTTPSGTYPGNGAYKSCVLLPDGKVFMIPYNTDKARIYDPITDSLVIASPSFPQTGGSTFFSSGVLLPNGKVFCIPDRNDKVVIYDPTLDSLYISTINLGVQPNGSYKDVCLLPDGRVFAVGFRYLGSFQSIFGGSLGGNPLPDARILSIYDNRW